jgi:hypothetical protein
MEHARMKLDAAFEFISKLGAPFMHQGPTSYSHRPTEAEQRRSMLPAVSTSPDHSEHRTVSLKDESHHHEKQKNAMARAGRTDHVVRLCSCFSSRG